MMSQEAGLDNMNDHIDKSEKPSCIYNEGFFLTKM